MVEEPGLQCWEPKARTCSQAQRKTRLAMDNSLMSAFSVTTIEGAKHTSRVMADDNSNKEKDGRSMG